MQTMKRKYIVPETKCIKLDASMMLAGSSDMEGQFLGDDFNDMDISFIRGADFLGDQSYDDFNW